VTALTAACHCLPDSAAAPAVSAVGLGMAIDGRTILRGVDFTLAPGSALSVLGANGAGKSTLLRIVATLIPASAGVLRLFGQPVGRGGTGTLLRRRIGMIGHQPMLYRDLSVLENMVFFGRLYQVSDPAARAAQMLEMVGLSERAGDAVKTLSRGQVQRVAIARALMHDPQLLLADEPFAGLDAPSANFLARFLLDLRRQGKSLILTTHDLRQGLQLAQHVMILHRGSVRLSAPAAGLDPATLLREVAP
jgi:heme exporter protein A